MKLKPFIERIISEIGPRPAGSESEFKTGEIIADEFKKNGAKIEYHDATCCPNSISSPHEPHDDNLCYRHHRVSLFSIAAAILVGFLLLLLLLMRIFGNGVIDWLFPRAKTRNIIGIYKPKGKAKRHLTFSGHHDSPNMMPLFYSRFKKHIHVIETIVLLGMALVIPAGVIKGVTFGFFTMPGISLHWYDAIYLVSILGLIPGFYYRFTMISKVKNLGANDNLSAVAVLLGIADHLKKNPPKQTEVWLVSYGAEEPLIYGSAGFAKDCFPAVIKKAVNFNMETLGAGKLAIIKKEKMTMTSYTPEVVDFIWRAGKRAGIDLPKIAITYGGTDSYPIIKRGGKSACLFGMDETELFSSGTRRRITRRTSRKKNSNPPCG